MLCAKRQKYAQIVNLAKMFTLWQIMIGENSIHDYRRLVSSESCAAYSSHGTGSLNRITPK